MLAHLLPHEAPNVVLLGAPDHRDHEAPTDPGKHEGHGMQGSRTDAVSRQGPGARGVGAWGAGGAAQPTPAHTHCQRSFSLLATGASGSRPPLRAMGGTGL